MKYGLFGKVNVSCEEEEIYIVANEAITPQNHVLRLPLFMFPPPHPSLKEYHPQREITTINPLALPPTENQCAGIYAWSSLSLPASEQL